MHLLERTAILNDFNYEKAFSRNFGWLNKEEQLALRSKRIAIAGLGGVGGSHLLTLARLGIESFTVADLDEFELANFNRQAGAFTSTIGSKKTDVLVRIAKEINPNLDVRVFPEGVSEASLGDFLSGADLYLDGLDFFAIAIRRKLFDECAIRRIPAVTAAPLGMGAALLNFLPGRMTYEEYFRLAGQTENEQLVRFLVGLSPAMLQRSYLIEKSAVDLENHKGPSTPMACDICAGMAATQVLKILLRRGRVLAAPWGQQFDPYKNRYAWTWRPFGNANPLNKLAIVIAKKILAQ
jgi:molybdopterin/thiamine biosynthesis adenylyltransferase